MWRRLVVAGLVLLAVGCRAAPAAVGPPAPPAMPPQPSVPPRYVVYKVQEGDTLYTLGERFGVPWEEIRDINAVEPKKLAAGMPLLIPAREGAKEPQPAAPKPSRSGPPRTAVAQADLHEGQPSARFWWPTHGRLVRRHGETVRGLPDSGIGISAPMGLEVYAAAAGTVISVVRSDPSAALAWGNSVTIAHPGGMATWYAQLDQVLVEKGNVVAKGQPIGTVGMGAAGRPELAFRIFRNDRPVDPADYLP